MLSTNWTANIFFFNIWTPAEITHCYCYYYYYLFDCRCGLPCVWSGKKNSNFFFLCSLWCRTHTLCLCIKGAFALVLSICVNTVYPCTFRPWDSSTTPITTSRWLWQLWGNAPFTSPYWLRHICTSWLFGER